MGGKVGENPVALRAAVFSLSSKNLRGAFKRPPPSRARVKLSFPSPVGHPEVPDRTVEGRIYPTRSSVANQPIQKVRTKFIKRFNFGIYP